MIGERLFFLTTIPGLESAAYLELCDKWARASAFFSLPPFPKVEFFKGGVEFQAPLHLGLLLSSQLRTANRVLLRHPVFPCEDEKQFERGLKAVSWDQYFPQGSHFDFQFTSRSSLISMKNQVLKNLQKVLQKHKVTYQKNAPSIFVRIFRDQCNISFDCSGELLFKRGEGKTQSVASLRESTASALLRILFQGINEPFQLIDPMCGSGTFLTEALQIDQPLQRHFAYEDFPIFKELENKAKFEFTNEDVIKPNKVIGFDYHEKAVHLAQANGKKFSPDIYQIHKADVFSTYGTKFIDPKLKKVVVVNPPWGKRLPAAEKDLLKAINQKFKPDRIGYLIPAQWNFAKIPLEKARDVSIVNSGVENRFLVFS